MPPIWLIAIIARTGIAAKFQKLAAWAAMVLFVMAVVGLLIVAFQRRDAAIATDAVSSHDKDLTIEAANMVIAAGEKADANQMAREDVDARNDKELQHEVDTKGTDAVAGPAVSGVLDRVRQQQAAGARR